MRALIVTLIIFIAFFVFLCSTSTTEEDIYGKYSVSVEMHKAIDTSTEAGKNAAALLSTAKIKYEFLENGTVKTTTTVGETENSEVLNWSYDGSSIFINAEEYELDPVAEGYRLKGKTHDLVLEFL